MNIGGKRAPIVYPKAQQKQEPSQRDKTGDMCQPV